MQRAAQFLAIGVAVCILGLTAARARAAADKEEEIALEKVPKAVLAAVKKKFSDAKLQGAARQTEDDQIFYEIFIKHKGHELYVVCEAEGKIIEVDREIGVKELPKPVFEALKKKYPKANILTVEEVTADDEITYAVILKHNKKTSHVVFDPKGAVLEEEPLDDKK